MTAVQPHQDPALHEEWLETLEYLIEDMLEETGEPLTYKGFIEACIETAFDTWKEEGPEFADTYFERVSALYEELRFLRRLEHQNDT